MILKSFNSVSATSTIAERQNVVIKYTPVYPIFNSKNSEFFSLGEFLPAFVTLNGQNYITYPLRPNKVINLLSISSFDDTEITTFLDDKITVKCLTFYIGRLCDPFGTTILYTPSFEFEGAPNGVMMEMSIDKPFEHHDPRYTIKGRMKGELRLDIGIIKVWTEDVSVTDESGKDISDLFHFVGYTVDATKVFSKPKQ